MKSLLTLYVLVATLALPEPPGPKSTFTYVDSLLASSELDSSGRESSLDIAREHFQVGPFFLDLGMRTTRRNPTEDSQSAISRIGVNTDFSTSLDPLSIRAIIVLNIETNDPFDSRQSAILRMPDAKSPPEWEGSIAKLMNGS